MTTSKENYPPDYEGNKHLIDDPIDEVEEVGEYDDSDEYREQQEESEVPLFEEM